MSYFGKLFGDDKVAQLDQKNNEIVRLLSQHDEELSRKDAEISRYEKEFSRKDAEISRYEAELSRKETEISRYEKELSRYEEELSRYEEEFSRKDTELDQKNNEIIRLLNLLSQREEESVKNSIVMIELTKKLSQRDEEIVQAKPEIMKLKQDIRDITFVEPIDIQEKLGEMFDIYDKVRRNISPAQVSEVSEKIRTATEQIKEPIVDLFHITYTKTDSAYYSPGTDINGTAFIITTSNIYRLHYSSRGSQENPNIFINATMDIYNYSYKWIKVETIDNSINLKTLCKYIKTTSGYTGDVWQNSSGNSLPTGCADKVAERLVKNMIDLVMVQKE